jgi:hypothetical protein
MTKAVFSKLSVTLHLIKRILFKESRAISGFLYGYIENFNNDTTYFILQFLRGTLLFLNSLFSKV